MINLCSRSTTDPVDEVKTGDILREKEIYKTSSSGIYVKLSSTTRGFCSANHLTDKNKVLNHISRDFPVGKKVTCRVMKYNHMDQLFIVSLQKFILEQQVSIRNLCIQLILLFHNIASVMCFLW